MMIPRNAAAELSSLLEAFPIVTLTGPRQSGKTTLARAIRPDKPYQSLEDPDVRQRALTDPRGFLAGFRGGAILDEVQRAPELLSYLQTIVDEDRAMGAWILTGSAQFQLLQGLTQSLAGRSGLLTLQPLTLGELRSFDRALAPADANRVMTRGFYPAIFDRSIEPGRYYRSYFQTFVERDVRLIANVSSMPDFERFIRLVAGRVGQLANLSSLATEVGVSQPTIRSWLNVLETACLIHRLPPYHENFGKRVVKTPKLYFNDTGLACYLLGIETPEQLARDPLRGNLFENFCVMELVKQRLNAGRDPGLYFFRDAHGHEVDLLFVSGSTLRPIEIKSGATFHGSFLDGVTRFRAVGGPRVQAPTVIYGGDQSFELAGARVVAWSALDAESLALPVQPAPS